MRTPIVKNVIAGISLSLALVTVCAPSTSHAGLFDWFPGFSSPPDGDQMQQDDGDQPHPPHHSAPAPSHHTAAPTPNAPAGNHEIEPIPQDTPGHRVTSAEQDEVALGNFLRQPRIELPMYVTKTEWTDADEANYGKFIHTLGLAVQQGKCGTIESCMTNPAINMYAQFDPPGLMLYSDCAKFPYLLRTYFAYHNGLPFGYATEVKINPRPYASANDLDDQLSTARLDNSPYGNVIVARGGLNSAAAPGREPNFLNYFIHMVNEVSTRTFRVGPLTPNYQLSDVYPVTLDQNGIGPGTIVNANGHSMTVWNIDASGMIQIIDAHPGAFVQYHPLDSTKLKRSRPDQGIGFFRFRPLRLVGATLNANGAYYGGKIVTKSDQELFQAGKYSLDQFFGAGAHVAPGSTVDPNAWKNAFKQVGFWDYLTSQMRDANSVVQADAAVVSVLKDLCQQLQDRTRFIDDSITAGVSKMAHPSSIPADIFGSDNQIWEADSSPGGDARLKDSIRNVLNTAAGQFRLAKSGSKNVLFAGSAQDFQTLILQRVSETSAACPIAYHNSTGAKVPLAFNDALSRVNKMSFDPYMCPEKSWGASGAEMATCRDQDTGAAWYNAEQNIRNTVGKSDEDGNSVVRSNQPITLSMLRDPSLVDQAPTAAVNLGTKKIPIMNLTAALSSPNFIQLLNK